MPSHTEATITSAHPMSRPTMPLRNNQHQVKLVRPNGSTRPVLGTALPEEDTRRAQAVEQWQIPGHEGRPPQDKPATIDEPLPVRTQTILSYRLPEEVRRLVNGGVTDAAPASRKTQETIGVRIDIKLD